MASLLRVALPSVVNTGENIVATDRMLGDNPGNVKRRGRWLLGDQKKACPIAPLDANRTVALRLVQERGKVLPRLGKRITFHGLTSAVPQQQFLNVPIAEAKAEVEPNRVGDDLVGEAKAFV